MAHFVHILTQKIAVKFCPYRCFFSFWLSIIFGKSLQYLKKEMRDEVDFLYRETSKFPASLYCYIWNASPSMPKILKITSMENICDKEVMKLIFPFDCFFKSFGTWFSWSGVLVSCVMGIISFNQRLLPMIVGSSNNVLLLWYVGVDRLGRFIFPPKLSRIQK